MKEGRLYRSGPVPQVPEVGGPISGGQALVRELDQVAVHRGREVGLQGNAVAYAAAATDDHLEAGGGPAGVLCSRVPVPCIKANGVDPRLLIEMLGGHPVSERPVPELPDVAIGVEVRTALEHDDVGALVEPGDLCGEGGVAGHSLPDQIDQLAGGREAGVLGEGVPGPDGEAGLEEGWSRVLVGDDGSEVGCAIPELPEVGPLVVEGVGLEDHGVPAHQAEGEGGVQVIAGVWLCQGKRRQAQGQGNKCPEDHRSGASPEHDAQKAHSAARKRKNPGHAGVSLLRLDLNQRPSD